MNADERVAEIERLVRECPIDERTVLLGRLEQLSHGWVEELNGLEGDFEEDDIDDGWDDDGGGVGLLSDGDIDDIDYLLDEEDEVDFCDDTEDE
jgi:hypothetical protein